MDQTGILLINKPGGWTSHDVVDKIRQITGQRRVGHAGTLDPLATGLLIVLVGRQFTKLQSGFLQMKKEYFCQAKLGTSTDSLDITGVVTKQVDWDLVKQITKKQLVHALHEFHGEIMQTVPMFSATKVGGKKLYTIARKNRAKLANKSQNISLTKPPSKKVTIFDIKLEEFSVNSPNKESLFSVRTKVSSGTYIRSLVRDIGAKLGVGATIVKLERTAIGKLSLTNAQSLEEFSKKQAGWIQLSQVANT